MIKMSTYYDDLKKLYKIYTNGLPAISGHLPGVAKFNSNNIKYDFSP